MCAYVKNNNNVIIALRTASDVSDGLTRRTVGGCRGMTREQSADFRRRKHASSGGCGGWTWRVSHIPTAAAGPMYSRSDGDEPSAPAEQNMWVKQLHAGRAAWFNSHTVSWTVTLSHPHTPTHKHDIHTHHTHTRSDIRCGDISTLVYRRVVVCVCERTCVAFTSRQNRLLREGGAWIGETADLQSLFPTLPPP